MPVAQAQLFRYSLASSDFVAPPSTTVQAAINRQLLLELHSSSNEHHRREHQQACKNRSFHRFLNKNETSHEVEGKAHGLTCSSEARTGSQAYLARLPGSGLGSCLPFGHDLGIDWPCVRPHFVQRPPEFEVKSRRNATAAANTTVQFRPPVIDLQNETSNRSDSSCNVEPVLEWQT